MGHCTCTRTLEHINDKRARTRAGNRDSSGFSWIIGVIERRHRTLTSESVAGAESDSMQYMPFKDVDTNFISNQWTVERRGHINDLRQINELISDTRN